MGLLLGKYGQCALGLSSACQILFSKIPDVDPASQGCAPCKEVAYKAICRVLHADGDYETKAAWAAMEKIRAPKAWMFGADIFGVFVANIGGVDDDRWSAWWRTNGVGPQDAAASARSFFERVVARHAAGLRQNLQIKLQKAALTTATLGEIAQVNSGRVIPPKATAPADGPDVGDLHDVGGFEPAPQETPVKQSADEVRATSGPAQERRRRNGKADAPSQPAKVGTASVVAMEIKKPAEVPAQQ